MAKEAVVIGAGIIGLCSAEALLLHGFRVTILDREQAGSSASFGNGGLVVPSHFEPLASPGLLAAGLRMMLRRGSPFGFRSLPSAEVLGWIMKLMRAANPQAVERASSVLLAMNLASRELYETHFADLTFDYARTGELMICRTAQALKAETSLAETAAKLGLEVEVVGREGLRQLDPNFEIDAAGGVFFADDARLSPPAFMQSLTGRLKRSDVRIQEGVEVSAIEADRVVTSVGEFKADLTVVAAGAWSGTLCRTVGIRLPLLGGKGYGFTLPDLPAMPQLPGILVEARVAYNPVPEGLRFVGAMELGPAVPQPDDHRRIAGMQTAITAAFPQLRPAAFPSEVWSGMRPCSPDGLPYVGRLTRAPNCIVATGHGMMGMSLGPITGHLVGEIAANQKPSIPLDLLNPERYA